MWKALNIIQGLFIFTWTAICGLLGILFLPLLWSRKRVIFLMARIIWSPIICAVAGVRVTIEGKENIPRDRSSIFIANHSSLFDIVALSRVMPIALFFVAKMELRKVPFLGWYMIALGHIFVDRKNKEQSMESMRIAAERIKGGQNVISFPEGTRSKDGSIQLFKRGSFIIAKEGKIDMVPIGISGASAVLPSNSFRLRPGHIRVRVGKVIDVDTFEPLSVEQLAELGRQRVIALIP
jgi:1-acyl-sn-glycerol-3-phosphate acyltransferase